jgi:hypothetical protein
MVEMERTGHCGVPKYILGGDLDAHGGTTLRDTLHGGAIWATSRPTAPLLLEVMQHYLIIPNLLDPWYPSLSAPMWVSMTNESLSMPARTATRSAGHSCLTLQIPIPLGFMPKKTLKCIAWSDGFALCNACCSRACGIFFETPRFRGSDLGRPIALVRENGISLSDCTLLMQKTLVQLVTNVSSAHCKAIGKQSVQEGRRRDERKRFRFHQATSNTRDKQPTLTTSSLLVLFLLIYLYGSSDFTLLIGWNSHALNLWSCYTAESASNHLSLYQILKCSMVSKPNMPIRAHLSCLSLPVVSLTGAMSLYRRYPY